MRSVKRLTLVVETWMNVDQTKILLNLCALVTFASCKWVHASSFSNSKHNYGLCNGSPIDKQWSMTTDCVWRAVQSELGSLQIVRCFAANEIGNRGCPGCAHSQPEASCSLPCFHLDHHRISHSLACIDHYLLAGRTRRRSLSLLQHIR